MMKKNLLMLCAACALFALQGVQAATYSFRNDPFTYDTPSGTASTVTWHAGTDGTWLGSPACTSYPNGDDDWADVVFPGGFTFVYGGVTYSQVRIYSNGMLAFGNDVSGFHRDYTPQNLPITTAGTPGPQGNCTLSAVPVNLMIAYWIDIVAGSARGVTLDSVKYELLGTAPNRRFVITWNNVALFGTATTRYTFQIALFESAAGVNGNFEYRYTSGSSTGQNATVGVQLTTTDYTLYSYSNTFIDTVNGTNIHWYPQTTLASAAGVYHFDETTWDGTPGQVLDSSGIVPAQNATSVGSATAVTTTPCGYGHAGSFPANTSNTVISAVATPLTLGNTGSIDFWYRSNVAWNTNNSQAMLFDATTVANRPFYLMKTATGALQFTASDSAGTISTTTSANQNFAANTWQHIGVSWVFLAGTNQTFIQIFLNGALLTNARYTTTGAIATLGTLYIGDNRTSNVTPSGGSGNSANGYIDEVKVYTSQINVYQVAADMSCTALIDHLLIQSPSSTGLTCISNPLTVVACQNAACTVRYTAGVTGTLSGTGTNMTVNWDGTTGGAPGAGFSMGSIGSVVKNVQVVTQSPATSGTVTFAISAPNPVPTNATVCNFGNNSPANNNCAFTVSNAGFIFSNSVTGGIYTIPAQISGIATPAAPAANAVYLRAVQSSNNNPAVCTPALINSTTAVNMGYACNNPTTCQPGNLVLVNATAIPGSPNSNPTQNSAPVNLTFDANGSAPITVRYDDVGQITLNAAVTPFTGATPLTGSSTFVVKPDHFVLSGIQQTAAPNLANPGAADATGSAFVKAGELFSVTVTAKNALGGTTMNYGQEIAPESVKLTSTLVAPSGGVNPGVGGTFGAFSGGVAIANGITFLPDGVTRSTPFAWGEVGVITLTPSVGDSDYLGAGNVTGTVSGNVGRFYPDHFSTAITAPMNCTGLTFVPACPGNGLVYSGQAFTTQVTALNANAGITQNYAYSATPANSFARNVTLSAVASPGGAASGAGTITAGTPMAASVFSGGSGSLSTTVFTFTATPTGPTDVYIRAADAEASSLLSVAANSAEGGLKVVSGRIKVSNAYGSELLPLTLNASAQYFTATGWVNSISDNVTHLVLPATYPVGSGTTAVTLSPSTGTLLGGALGIKLGKPTSGAGTATVNPTAPGYLPVIPGTATFGVYKSNNGYIYRRESY